MFRSLLVSVVLLGLALQVALALEEWPELPRGSGRPKPSRFGKMPRTQEGETLPCLPSEERCGGPFCYYTFDNSDDKYVVVTYYKTEIANMLTVHVVDDWDVLLSERVEVRSLAAIMRFQSDVFEMNGKRYVVKFLNIASTQTGLAFLSGDDADIPVGLRVSDLCIEEQDAHQMPSRPRHRYPPGKSRLFPQPPVSLGNKLPGQYLSIVNKPTKQSTTFIEYTSDKAADGSRSVYAYPGFKCTITTEEGHPWWRVDLEGEHCISSVSILNRGDCCSDRLTNAVVRAGASTTVTDNAACGSPVTAAQASPRGGEIWMQCEAPMRARYVSVDIPYSGILQLCELRVKELPLSDCAVAEQTRASSSPVCYDELICDPASCVFVNQGSVQGHYEYATVKVDESGTAIQVWAVRPAVDKSLLLDQIIEEQPIISSAFDIDGKSYKVKIDVTFTPLQVKFCILAW